VLCVSASASGWLGVVGKGHNSPRASAMNDSAREFPATSPHATSPDLDSAEGRLASIVNS
jgi:hypothetical protein